MARTSVADVLDIADFDKLTQGELQAFVDDALTYVDNQLGDSATTAEKQLVDPYVAAHLASMKQQRIAESETGDTSFNYEGDFTSGQKIMATRYGQMAVMLDPTGKLGVKRHHVNTVNEAE